MPVSKQQPLTASRGGHVHDFTQSSARWEAAVFDQAVCFAVVKMARRGESPERHEFWCFPWAARFARDRRDVCLYAVASTGRFALIDREKWDEWEIRWWETRDEHGREDSRLAGAA